MMNMNPQFNFTYADIQGLASTKGKTVTKTDLKNDKAFQERKAQIENENKVYENMVNTIKAMNNNKLSDDEAKALAEKMGCKYTDINDFESEYMRKLQEDRDCEARENAYKKARQDYDNFMEAMGLNTQPQQPAQQVINLNAVVSNQEPKDDEIDEKSMSWKDRCDYIEELSTGSSHGNSQFRRHLSVRHQNIGAKALVKEWYKAGYITLAEKNSLLFMCNINACSNHINVTARK